MTLFLKRYSVEVVGFDGLIHEEKVSHVLVVSPTRFLLEKKARKPIRKFECIDTLTGKPISNAELHAE